MKLPAEDRIAAVSAAYPSRFIQVAVSNSILSRLKRELRYCLRVALNRLAFSVFGDTAQGV